MIGTSRTTCGGYPAGREDTTATGLWSSYRITPLKASNSANQQEIFNLR